MAARRLRHSPSGSPANIPEPSPPFVPTALEGSALIWPALTNPPTDHFTDWALLDMPPEDEGAGYFLRQVGELWTLSEDTGLPTYSGPPRWFWLHALCNVRFNHGLHFGDGSEAGPLGSIWVGREAEAPTLATANALAQAQTPTPTAAEDVEGLRLVVTAASQWQLAAVNLVELQPSEAVAIAFASLIETPGLIVERATLSILPASGAVQMPPPAP